MLIVHQAAGAAIACLAQHKEQCPGPIVQAQATSQCSIFSEGPALPRKHDEWETPGRLSR